VPMRYFFDKPATSIMDIRIVLGVRYFISDSCSDDNPLRYEFEFQFFYARSYRL